MSIRASVNFILGFSLLCVPVWADVKLPAVFGDNMVLQRNSEVAVWGWAEPGEEVSVAPGWRDRAATTRAAGNGEWKVTILTSEPGGPHVIFVQGKNEIVLNNVMVGEVWICSGQSNMEMPIDNVGPGYEGVVNYEEELASAGFPDIRLFNVERRYSPAPQNDCKGLWQICTSDTVGGFSAVGYFFGRRLHEALDVPIGLIGTNWGGTPAEAWTSEATLEKMPYFATALEDIRTARADAEQLEPSFQEKMVNWRKSLDEADMGMREQWMAVDFDDSAWEEMTLPQNWDHAGLAEFDGFVWFRTTVEIPAGWSGKALLLELGPIDDMDVTWFNGTRVGGIEELYHWQTPRQYTIPEDLVHPGANVIAVRIHDTGGLGGIYGKPEQLRIHPPEADDAVSLAGEWRYMKGVDASELAAMPMPRRIHNEFATVLYNGMIAPLVPFGIRGAVWYQGESNCSRAYQYRVLFPAMINDWRMNWEQGDFPFYYVQIAPYKYSTELVAAELREAQLMALSVANTGMAVTTDIANLYDIHPRNKQDVGNRLALWALARTYGKDLVCSGPLYKDMAIEGSKIRIRFDHVGGGLAARDGELTHFAVAGADQSFVPAKAQIDNDTLLVSSEEVAEPVAVRFGWSNTAEPNLFNAAGLPASPFRTDDWPGVTHDNR